MANAMIVIRPYLQEGIWVFDDESVGLEQEPFVAGVPEMIEAFVKDIPNAADGFELTFSAQPFPGFQAKLVWLRREYDGNWYGWPETRQEGWLCPALFRYFDKPPAEIYCRASALKGDRAGTTDKAAQISLADIDEKLDLVLEWIGALTERVAALELEKKPPVASAATTAPRAQLDEFIERFFALSPEDQRASLMAANAYLATERGQAERGLPPEYEDEAKRLARLERQQ